ncbi:MAG: hypothetical protein LBN26_03145 [Christensenellaceae bacterium]|jgi:hypothetical protein|nr:hypothetical protein [Christensenellaceae bacterium]
MKRKQGIVILALCAALALAGCGGKARLDPKNPGRMLSFAYEYGSFNGGQYEYSITREMDALGGEHLYFSAKGSNGVDLRAAAEIEQPVLEELASIFAAHNIYAWDGFNKRNDNILDGYGFSLSADFEGGSLAASGYEKEPRGYGAGHAALAGYLETLARGMKAPALEDIEKLSSLWMEFDEGFSIRAEYSGSEGFLVTYLHGDTRERYDEAELGAEAVRDYVTYIAGLYNDFKDTPASTGGDLGGYITAYFPFAGSEVGYDVAIDKTKYPEIYEEYLTRSLAIVGKAPDFLQSAQYETEAYKSGFTYPEFYFYDRGGLGAVVVDMPKQTVTVNGETYMADRQTMLDLHDVVYGHYAQFPFITYDEEIRRAYLAEGETAQGVFEGFIQEGYAWLLGSNHGLGMLQLFGGKGAPPSGWEAAAALVESIVAGANKV